MFQKCLTNLMSCEFQSSSLTLGNSLLYGELSCSTHASSGCSVSCSETHRWCETLLELSCSETCLCTCLCILMPFSYREGQHLSHWRLLQQQFSVLSFPHTKWFCKIQDPGLLYNVNMWNGLPAFQSYSMTHSTVQNKGDFVSIEPLAPFL